MRLSWHWLLIPFFLWQMASVAIVSIPFHAPDPISAWIRRHLIAIVDPYIFATSQWQRWWVFVRERPPSEIQYFVQQLNKQGDELALVPVPMNAAAPLRQSCLDPTTRPFAVHLIRRSYLGIDYQLPARSPLFVPRWWEQTIIYRQCDSLI